MIFRHPHLMGTHPKHGEIASTNVGAVVRYCDSCGDWLLCEPGKGCIRCDKPWKEED